MTIAAHEAIRTVKEAADLSPEFWREHVNDELLVTQHIEALDRLRVAALKVVRRHERRPCPDGGKDCSICELSNVFSKEMIDERP